MQKKQGFTLVELIVVITILTILWTIAFISFWWYTKNARDSVRKKDIGSIKTGLELFLSQRGILPIPENAVSITYSWWTVFYHGTFWDGPFTNIGTINKKPVDPLYDVEYNYAISSTKRSYNIAWIQEWDRITQTKNLFPQTYADTATREMVARVDWSYNGQIVHTSTGGQIYVFAVPSLILTDTEETDMINISDKFVYNIEENLPASYKEVWATQVWTFEFTPQIVYSWSNLPKTPEWLSTLIENLQDSIVGTVLYSKPEYRNLLEIDINNSEDLYNYGVKYINQDLWGRFQLVYAKNCAEILGTEDDKWSGEYTISPNSIDKIKVYCDMDMDGWGWTRIRKWERGIGYTDIKTVNQTAGISGTEMIVVYSRFWKTRVNNWAWWEDYNFSNKKYGLYYEKFETKQWDQNGECWEYTEISNLISHITSGSRWNCSRDCHRPWWLWTSCDGTKEYVDIQVDDLWEDIGLTNDRVWNGFDDDPCVINGHKTSDRNVSWNDSWMMSHRIDSSTSLISLWWSSSSRCAGLYRSDSRLIDRINSWSSVTSSRWINSSNYTEYISGFQTNEVYIR